MTRNEWVIAWRFARRTTKRHDRLDERRAAELARAELGRALPLAARTWAYDCKWRRDHERDELRAIHLRVHYPLR